jgi:AAA+ superfamily predicted ATPase
MDLLKCEFTDSPEGSYNNFLSRLIRKVRCYKEGTKYEGLLVNETELYKMESIIQNMDKVMLMDKRNYIEEILDELKVESKREDFTPDKSSIKRYITDCYPQFIAPIEEIQWSDWGTEDDIPDGKYVIWMGFYSLSMALSNIDNNFSIEEVDFFRNIKQIFDEDEDEVNNLSSQELLKIYRSNFESSKHLVGEIKIPIPLEYLDIYDNNHGTNFGQNARTMYFRYANALVKADGKITSQEIEALEKLKNIFYPTEYIPSKTLIEIPHSKNNEENKSRSLDELLSNLNNLVGLDDVKKDVQEMVNFLKIQQLRESKGMSSTPISKHLVFLGNPGTGKTTIARLLSEIYKALNVISSGHLVETDRAGLVAGYVGQTALKVHDVVNKALGGILFIDEAYTLNGEGQDFGSEAIDTLLKLMEDNRNDLIVIVAGYTEKMNKFLLSNPGFKSRFNKYISFQDYSPEQLQKIFVRLCENGSFKLTLEAEKKLLETFEIMYKEKDETFGNARLARNIFENAVNNQANRIINLTEITEELLSTIEINDIPSEVKI